MPNVSARTAKEKLEARRVSSGAEWDDLVLSRRTMDALERVIALASQKRGVRALFSGPSGTGKTFAAILLGKRLRRPVYRVDLSAADSKYIGETEKNLAALFERAEAKGWILFFDEADSLFGKRSEVKDAHDRYANQEVSYLLKRAEAFDGLAIFEARGEAALDGALAGSIDARVAFEPPEASLRLRLWEKSLAGVDEANYLGKELGEIARRHKLSCSEIARISDRVVRQAKRGHGEALFRDRLERTIRRELTRRDDEG